MSPFNIERMGLQSIHHGRGGAGLNTNKLLRQKMLQYIHSTRILKTSIKHKQFNVMFLTNCVECGSFFVGGGRVAAGGSGLNLIVFTKHTIQ